MVVVVVVMWLILLILHVLSLKRFSQTHYSLSLIDLCFKFSLAQVARR